MRYPVLTMLPRLRSLFSNPAYTLVAGLSLAIGIGANTAIFSVTNALLLQPLPYRNADRLVILWNRSPGLNIAEDWFSTAQYFDIRNGHSGFEQVAIAIGGTNNLTGGTGEPERIGTVRVSSQLLPMLGAGAFRGRLFTAAEDVPGHAPLALLSYGLWMRRYGGDDSILGKPIYLNGQPYEVAGVLPREFRLPHEVLPLLGGGEQADIVLPLPLSAKAITDRDHEDYNILGVLKPGVSVEQAQAAMDAITARLRREFPVLYPPNGGLTFSVVPIREQVAGNARRGLYLLLGAVGFVLLTACANVANLGLTRAAGRTRELALRSALGATRGRILRELLTETIALSLAGGAVGALLAAWSLAWIRSTGATPRAEAIEMDWSVLAYTFLLSLLAGMVAGILPAWRASSLDLQTALNDAGRAASSNGALWGSGSNRMRRILVAAELALAVVLLTGAGLLVESLIALGRVDPGFDARDVLTFSITMSGHRYDLPEKVLASYRDLWERLGRIPGVQRVGGVSSLPLTQSFAWGPITIEGRPLAPGEAFINADWRMVSGRYFDAMGIPLLKGRLFDEHDNPHSTLVAVIDDRMAHDLWPGQDPLGRRIRLGTDSNSKLVTVAGVVGSVKQYGLTADSRIAIYVPQSQFTTRAMSVVVKTAANAPSIVAAAKQAVQAIDSDLPVYNVRTMSERVAESLARKRFVAVLLAIFAGLAVVLAAVGVYGVMAFLVGQSRKEIGIRMALGATSRAITVMVLRSVLTIAALGLGVGAAAALALSQLIRSMLYGVQAADPWTLSASVAGLLVVALFASYWPALQASRVDPASTIREE